MTDWSLPPERPFRVIENDWIPMRDGTRLAVRLWLPEGSGPVPAVLEYIPYRKRDHYRQRDDAWGRLLARHGFAFARADVRGSGESEGVLLAEYTEQEQRDALDIIAWLAAREWCNGAVGMRGISWGGFNSFQVAAHAPPALKAIMPMCFSDRRFTDDAHYLGGALTHPNYGWGLMFKTVMAGPPDPAIVGERWKSMWLDRLHATPAILATWTAHQRADAYWQVGSVAPGYDRIRCAVYAVCGLADYFVNVAARVMGTLSVPRKCLIGPWAHDYPYSANPGPGLDWAHEEIRWWDEWLNGTDTGIMHEPMFRAYMADRTPAETYPQDVPGRWVAEAEWPSHRIGRQVLFMNHRGLSPQIEEPAELTCAGDRVVGTLQREVHEFYMPEDLPCDQTEDDRRSLTFDSPPLEADLEIMGNAVATIRVAADVPVAKLAVRLCEVTTEGKSWLVSYGILNLTHRDGHEHPVALEPGVPVTATIALLFTAHRFHTGSRIRVALSESLWPLAWPSPRVATLRITTGLSSLALPVRPPSLAEAPFTVPLVTDANRSRGPSGASFGHTGPDEQGRVAMTKRWDPAPVLIEDAGTVHEVGWREWRMEMDAGDPASCVWTGDHIASWRRDGWGVSVEARFELRADAQIFRLRESLVAREAGETIFETASVSIIPRDLV